MYLHWSYCLSAMNKHTPLRMATKQAKPNGQFHLPPELAMRHMGPLPVQVRLKLLKSLPELTFNYCTGFSVETCTLYVEQGTTHPRTILYAVDTCYRYMSILYILLYGIVLLLYLVLIYQYRLRISPTSLPLFPRYSTLCRHHQPFL